MKKILFLDLDGTVREPASGSQFISRPDDQRLIEGVKEALKIYSNEWAMIGITNQAGVATGHKTLSNCILEQELTLHLVPRLLSIYFCPDYEGKLCYRVYRDSQKEGAYLSQEIGSKLEVESYRKPGRGMVQLASKIEGFSLAKALMVGDREVDMLCAQAANVNFMWAEDWKNRFR